MDQGSSRKRKLSPPRNDPVVADVADDEDMSTDIKLAILASLHPQLETNELLDLLINADGCVEMASSLLSGITSPRKKLATSSKIQSSLASFTDGNKTRSKLPLTRKGKTLHLYSSEDIENHTPCSVIHNFLEPDVAENLLLELLEEAKTFGRASFKIFDNVVQSPHTACFYVDNSEEQDQQKTEYLYNGSYLDDVRQLKPQMRSVSSIVQKTVNQEIQRRIKKFSPNGKKLKYQSPKEWIPNAAFVNCYVGGAESVGYHSDQLTYLGPRAVIGSLSLGVEREFRVRRVVARDEDDADEEKKQPSNSTNNISQKNTRADAEGQIAIHLPHNSLLIMHAEMQEEWKHSIAPAAAIDPHPIAGNIRMNITYRWYRESFHPRYTPRCACGVATVLRCVQRKKENRGKYMWMCHAGNTPGKTG